MRIIDKAGSRCTTRRTADHCLQYMTAIGLIFGSADGGAL
jgi:2-methylcitrate dehydratase PrpD